MNKLHREEMLQAATEARDKYLQDHPEAAEINLKYDPLQHIQECKYRYTDRAFSKWCKISFDSSF